MSVTGASVFSRAFKPMLFDAFKAPSPYCYRCPWASNQKPVSGSASRYWKNI